jgi:hypothetical protein
MIKIKPVGAAGFLEFEVIVRDAKGETRHWVKRPIVSGAMRRGRVCISAGARAERVDPASFRFDGDLALFP